MLNLGFPEYVNVPGGVEPESGINQLALAMLSSAVMAVSLRMRTTVKVAIVCRESSG